MKLRYKYRIYPTPSQESTMIQVGGCVRFVFNHFLKMNIDEYAKTKKFIWYNDTAKLLTVLKKELVDSNGNHWLEEPAAQALQQSLKDLDQALKNMKRGAGFPKFKSKYTNPISFRFQQNISISNDKKYVFLSKIGLVRIKLHRNLPTFTGCTVVREARGWYASFVVDKQEQQLVDKVYNPVGVDVNSDFTALSTGELIINPKPLKKKNKKIKQLQRNLSRKKKGSNNRLKAKKKLARVHGQIRAQRLNHIHQLSARIAKEHDLVCVETLKIEEMRKKSKPVAKAVADAGWAMFLQALEYKCQLEGHHFIKINQWLPSSKTCSACGNKKSTMNLKERLYNCEDCSIIIHRDTNAAINIKNWGYQQWNLAHTGQELPEVPVDVVADVLTNYGEISATQMKQEATAL